jgi:hypothetical protein
MPGRVKTRGRKGQSVIEYAGMIALLLAAMFVFQKYVGRGLAGRWKASGEAWIYGRQYDPEKTVSCLGFHYKGKKLTDGELFFGSEKYIWFDEACFEEKCLETCYSDFKDSSSSDKQKTQCRKCMEECAANSDNAEVCSDQASPKG